MLVPTAESMQSIEKMTLSITQQMHVNAPLETTFAALLEQLGPAATRPDGAAMHMQIEPWPGGRWFRDLGAGNGHFWAHVQAIKRPELLELSGPLFMSYPAISNVQYRLTAADGGTLIEFHHLAMGMFSEDHRKGVTGGWKHILDSIRDRAERAALEPAK